MCHWFGMSLAARQRLPVPGAPRTRQTCQRSDRWGCPVGDLVAGATYPLRAWVVLSRTPSLWGYVVIPILVNLMVGAALYLGLLLAGLRYIDALIAGLPAWAAVLAVLLR